jgi:hypothetical protein
MSFPITRCGKRTRHQRSSLRKTPSSLRLNLENHSVVVNVTGVGCIVKVTRRVLDQAIDGIYPVRAGKIVQHRFDALLRIDLKYRSVGISATVFKASSSRPLFGIDAGLRKALAMVFTSARRLHVAT